MIMDMFEQVDKLRERADVSYEEAKSALERCNGDILEAMILLEREGKTRTAEPGCFSTARGATEGRGQRAVQTFREKLRALIHKGKVNHLVVERRGERILKIPVLAMILILILTWHVALIAFVISLFLECKYSFEGQDEMKTANDVFSKAGDIADTVKDKVVTGYNSL